MISAFAVSQPSHLELGLNTYAHQRWKADRLVRPFDVFHIRNDRKQDEGKTSERSNPETEAQKPTSPQ